MSATQPADLANLQPATHVRHVVLLYLCLLTFILYLDRICMGQAGPFIKDELNLSDTELGMAFSAFTLAYGLFMAAAGRLGDRYGSRGVLVGIAVWWSICTMLTGAATGLVMLLVIRFVFGAGEAGAFPNCARVVARWFPPAARGVPNGLLNTAALVGGAAAPVAAAYVIYWIDTWIAPTIYNQTGLRPSGWRWMFVLFGMVGAVWAVLFWSWYRDDPAEHPHVNAAERDYIRHGRPVETAQGLTVPPVPWRRVLQSRNIWLLGLINTCASFGSYLFGFWYPRYLQAARDVEKVQSGWLASAVMAGGAIGSVLGGLMGDRLLRGTGTVRSRCWIGAGAMALAALSLVASIFVDNVTAVTALTALAFCCLMLMIAPWWGAVSDISGPHLATLFGLANSLGIVGGIGSQMFFGAFADWRKDLGHTGRAQWDPAFFVYFAVLLAGAITWLFVDPRRSAVD